MIDKKTKLQILSKTKITDVISDYMKLSPRDNDFVGFCPFHTGKMNSFIIDTYNNTYQCTECGKKGSAIDFLIDSLHINYDEALRIMAKKCGIPVTPAEDRSEAETLYEINAEACAYYREQLQNSEAGKNIALPYYHQQRGFSDEIIQEFQLGYSPARQDNHLIDDLEKKGYSEDYIVSSGIGVRFEGHPSYDRFHERITFPISNLSGKIVAFSCRTMKRDSDIAKYKNTNDTPIYTKGNEIYGLYQARKHILELDKCILVEGNADVVSMHQAGFNYTVAPLGTGFTFNQACVLRRFTHNIILLFDGDNAGIHANEVALQHLLPLGVMPRIVLLPQGDDPDSFSRRLSHEEAEKFIEENSINLVQFYFKTKLNESLNNPIRTAQVVREIVQKIALIPDRIIKMSLVKECSHLLQINEESVRRDVQQESLRIKEEEFHRIQQAQARAQYLERMAAEKTQAEEHYEAVAQLFAEEPQAPESAPEEDDSDIIGSSLLSAPIAEPAIAAVSKSILKKERIIMHYVAKYGMVQFSVMSIGENEVKPINIIQYLEQEFAVHGIVIHDDTMKRIFELGKNLVADFESDYIEFKEQLKIQEKEDFDKGVEEIREKNLDIDTIEKEEAMLNGRIKLKSAQKSEDYERKYFETYLCSHPDKEIRECGLKLVNERFRLSKIHSQQVADLSEFKKLPTLIPEAINNLRYEMLTQRINALQAQLKTEKNPEAVMQLMTEQMEMQKQRQHLSEKCLGIRVINP